MIRPNRLIPVFATLALWAGARGESGERTTPGPGFPAKKLPVGWSVEKRLAIPSAQRAAIGGKLGGKIDELTNTVLGYRGRRVQVNVIRCGTAKDAGQVHRSIMKLKGHRWLCLLKGKTVVEFVCRDLRIARQAHYALGYEAVQVTYDVSFELAAIKEADYAAGNRLFNALLQLDQPDRAPAARRSVAALTKGFTFGSGLILRSCGATGKEPSYSFTHQVKSKQKLAGGELTAYSFGKLPSKESVPYVSVRATIVSRAFSVIPTGRKADKELLAPNRFWPAKDPAVVKLANQITAKARSNEEKAQLILDWLMPGRNIKYGGPLGSRRGVKATIKQGQGRCWDFSDCFVTLCRAAGVPCRQVAGWLYGQCGHVWAEFLLEGKGWVQVDPTAGMACGSDYIPYLTTEDGQMPIVYVSMPKIEIAADAGKNTEKPVTTE